MIKIHHRI